MPTIFVSGNDTNIGKTWVVSSILRTIPRTEHSVQLIKPVQTGIEYGADGDVVEALKNSGRNYPAFTLTEFSYPINPLDAAFADDKVLSKEAVLKKWHKLPPADWRIVEGAGGLAVPLDTNGYDFADFAKDIKADVVILVIESRLGSINQGRLTAAYACQHDLPAYLWLNEPTAQVDKIRESNRNGLMNLKTPLLATQQAGHKAPRWMIPAPWDTNLSI